MLKNCQRCHRIHSNALRDICPACYEAEEEEFSQVHAYVRDCPGLPVAEVSEATGVKVNRILQFLQQGRLNTHSVGTMLMCEICEKPMISGRVCEACLERLRQPSKEREERRMHITELERFQEREKM